MTSNAALDGLRVLELSSGISAPYCCRLLAGYGAEVIKIETPDPGDAARLAGPFPNDDPHPEKSGLFLYLNSGKKGITLNLKTNAGVGIFKRLVEDADILVENFEPSVLPALGLDYQNLRRLNPRLVMTSISSFGQTGPYRDFKATNLVHFAMGGQMALTGDPDREPLKNGGSQAEYQAGLNAFSATAIVSYGAQLSGEGQHVDISVMECLAATLEGSLAHTSYRGEVRKRLGNIMRALIGIYPCRDGYIGIHAMARNWPLIPAFLGMPELLDDPRFKDPASRQEHNDEMEAIMYDWAAQHDKMEIYERAVTSRVPIAPVVTTQELVESPQLKARGFFVEIDHPVAGMLTYPGAPFKMSESPWTVGRAPLLGEHNKDVFGTLLGYSGEEQELMRRQGIF